MSKHLRQEGRSGFGNVERLRFKKVRRDEKRFDADRLGDRGL
ncbi:hypothetical protein [Skermanella pratensis]|nr:hypothetical protein [Skermanella pratensis]